MFTAIVLVCAELSKSPQSCYTLTVDTILENSQQCEALISKSMELNYFDYYDETTGIKFKPASYMCVNWHNENI